MQVKDLLKLLADCDPESELILQVDSQGSGYLPLAGTDSDAVYDNDEGEVYSMDWSAGEALKTEEEWNEIKQQRRCVVLFP